MRRVALVAVCLAAVAALAGCATPTSPGEGDPTTTVSPGGSVTPSANEPDRLPSPSKGLPDISATVPGLGAETTVTGTVQEGVEKGCLLLEGYLLVSSPVAVRAGQRVTVTGRVDPNIVTTCQQGTPLIVSSVTPA